MNPAYKPMLATLVDEPFDAKGWVYETKWDGFRLITEKRRDNVTLWSRCVEFDRAFESITHLGVPDIRLIVYKGVPVMGMLRLPTSESEGKTNLHRGAIGAGIDLASGRTLTAVWRNSVVTQHPDTLANVSGSSRRARISRI